MALLEAQANIAGITFYQNPAAPAEYQGDLIITLHGGVTHAGEQVGMSVQRLDFDPASGAPLTDEVEPLAEGWWITPEPGDMSGRPFGLALAPNGDLFISDDSANAVYVLRYRG
ncbi:MAG: hypothetical protein HC915_03475 [Anaerolineae bacterium]|nr:hypothetical protein [Anaerolineae bacterium]